MLLKRTMRMGILCSWEAPRAATDQADNRPLGSRCLDSESRRQTSAQTANTAGKIGAGLDGIEIAVHRQPVRDRLLDDHGIRRQDLAELIRDPACVDGHFLLHTQRLLFPLAPSLLRALAPLLRALGQSGFSFGEAFFKRLKAPWS